MCEVATEIAFTARRDDVSRPGHVLIDDPVIDDVLKFWKSDFRIEPFGYKQASYATTPFDALTSAIEMAKVILYFRYHDWVFIGEDGQNLLTDADIMDFDSD